MRVLLIAPRLEELPNIDREIAGVVNSGLAVRLLNGNVGRVDVVREISNGEYDLLWLATHGVQEGVYLSDGILDASSLITYVVSNGIKSVFLNTCDSVLVANSVAQGAGADVIATVGPVGDREAFQTGALLAKHLAGGNDFRAAYELSKPGRNDSYIFLSGAPRTAPRRGGGGVDTQSAMLAHVEQQLRRVTTLIDGDATYGIAGIRKDLAQVLAMTQAAQSEMDGLRAELRSVSTQLVEERRERQQLREMLEEERRQRIAIQVQMDELSAALKSLGANMPSKRVWYQEWAGPALSLITIILLFYMMGVLLQ